jgi:hypothetical protein
MTANLERRIARLEATHGFAADRMVEQELSDEGKELLRELLTGPRPPDRIERIVSTKVLGPRALSPAAKQQLADVLDALSAPECMRC